MMFNRFKIFVFLLVAGFLFLTTAGPALAQEGIFGAYHKAAQTIGLEKDPAKDPLCWQAEVCYTALQQQFPDAEITKDNWQSPGPNGRCGSALGVCLPAGTTNLEIKIGETTQARDLGDYIKKIYIYLLSIGGIVAAVLLIKGGADWMLSVGESEGIKNAKATIAGALTGLLLLLGSYVLLYTINPDLVNLKLPQVYMVRPAQLLEMAEGQPCWEKGVENVACVGLGAPGEYTCRYYHKNGPMVTIAKAEGDLIVLVTSAWMPGVGAVEGWMASKSLTIGKKVGGWALGAVKKTGSKYIGAAFKTPWSKIAESWVKFYPSKIKAANAWTMEMVEAELGRDFSGTTFKAFAKAVSTTFVQGGKMALGVAGPVGFYLVSDKMYDMLWGDGKSGAPGFCSKTKKLAEGEFCNAELKPSDCASGACVAVADWSGWVSKMTIGVCSPGGAGNPCSVPADCGTDGGSFKCIAGECSDGTFDSTCESNLDCGAAGLVCALKGDGKKHCVSPSLPGEGEKCMIASESSGSYTAVCAEGTEFVVPPSNDPEFCICSSGQIGSSCYTDSTCKSDTLYKIGCYEADKKSQTDEGLCLHAYFNAQKVPNGGDKVLLNQIQDFTPENVGCSSNSDCPNASCLGNSFGENVCAGQ